MRIPLLAILAVIGGAPRTSHGATPAASIHRSQGRGVRPTLQKLASLLEGARLPARMKSGLLTTLREVDPADHQVLRSGGWLGGDEIGVWAVRQVAGKRSSTGLPVRFEAGTEAAAPRILSLYLWSREAEQPRAAGLGVRPLDGDLVLATLGPHDPLHRGFFERAEHHQIIRVADDSPVLMIGGQAIPDASAVRVRTLSSDRP